MFHYDRGLKLTRADLAVDFSRRQPRAFVSHAHADHMARHELALCTPATADLYQLRLGKRPVLTLPYESPLDWGGLRLTTYPAGHCLGSAMLLAEDAEQRLLYTGDFKLSVSSTATTAKLPRAETLVIESTYGTPAYRLPPREEAIGQFIELVGRTLERDHTPIVFAYALGKGQEITRILTDHGFPVVQEAKTFEISQVYERHGVALGNVRLAPAGQVPEGCVLVTPPTGFKRRGANSLAKRQTLFAVTGWAINPSTRFRLGVDHAVPISDHADYDELFEAVAQVDPQVVYCTHGPESFADRLREAGWNAYRLGVEVQTRLPGM